MAGGDAARRPWRRDWRIWAAGAALLAILLVELLMLWPSDETNTPRGLMISPDHPIVSLPFETDGRYPPGGPPIADLQREVRDLRAALCRATRRDARRDGHVDRVEAYRIERYCSDEGY